MSGGGQLRIRDAKAALAFSAALAECAEATELSVQVDALTGLVGADAVIVTSCREWGAIKTEIGDPETYRPDLMRAIERDWRDHPVMAPDLARPDRGARRISDRVGEREWRRRDLFNDFYRPLGLTGELSVQMAWGPTGSSCCLAVHRTGRDFGDRELLLLGLVAPHLRAARARIAAEARAPVAHDTAADLALRLPITLREAEVLTRLAAGRTNAGIAHDLGISPHTVVRHVEHIYAKLDVHTRAAATRIALGWPPDDANSDRPDPAPPGGHLTREPN